MGGSGAEDETGYLCVDDFIADVAGARSLASAFEFGLVDLLVSKPSCNMDELGAHAKLDARGLGLLLGMLQANRVVELAHGNASLTASFTAALHYRDLLEAKLDFANLVAPDFLGLFSQLLAAPERFFGKARLFELFSYQRCFEPTAENLANTARWVGITTALTRYEAAACIGRHDFSQHARMLDVGGNSGEFALQVCRRQAGLRATVYDLPLVCEIGAKHVATEHAGRRIEFVHADAGGGALPQGYDVVTFKSMLHDWPEAEMRRFLARAYQALAPGGTVLIFERSLVGIGDRQVPYSMLPLLLFFRSYRSSEDYGFALRAAGFRDVAAQTIELDMPFMLVTAKK